MIRDNERTWCRYVVLSNMLYSYTSDPPTLRPSDPPIFRPISLWCSITVKSDKANSRVILRCSITTQSSPPITSNYQLPYISLPETIRPSAMQSASVFFSLALIFFPSHCSGNMNINMPLDSCSLPLTKHSHTLTSCPIPNPFLLKSRHRCILSFESSV